VSKSSLVRFDHNRYSVAAKAARRTAQLRLTPIGLSFGATARSSGHTRRFVPARPLMIPGITCRCWPRSRRAAQRRSVPHWICRWRWRQIRRRLAGHDDGDRQFVDILTEVAEPGSTLSRRPVPRRSQPDCSAATRAHIWRGSATPIRPCVEPRRRALAIEPVPIAPATTSCAATPRRGLPLGGLAQGEYRGAA